MPRTRATDARKLQAFLDALRALVDKHGVVLTGFCTQLAPNNASRPVMFVRLPNCGPECGNPTCDRVSLEHAGKLMMQAVVIDAMQSNTPLRSGSLRPVKLPGKRKQPRRRAAQTGHLRLVT